MNRFVAMLVAFAIGAASDLLAIRNGLSSSGLTLLDKHPILWPVWLGFILLCACGLSFALADGPVRVQQNPAWAIWFGAIATHAVLVVKDLFSDSTSHNVWPIEFVFWGIVVALPIVVGILLAMLIGRFR